MPQELIKSKITKVSGVVTENLSAPLLDTVNLLKKDGDIRSEPGHIMTIFALSLAILSFFGVLAFHFPEYLTTPELRKIYSVELIRQILFLALVISGALSLANILLKRERSINITTFIIILSSVALGGSGVPVGDFPDHTPYVGLDWFILDLLGSTLIFIVIEKLAPLYKGQAIFRKEWQTDLMHFLMNHFLV